MRPWLLLSALILPAAAFATPQPLDALMAQLRQAGSPEEAKPIEQQILALFQHSNSASVDLLMTRADAAETAGDKDTAKKLYDAVTAIAPDFAEGWHKKGLLQSDAGDDEAAMVSLQKAVALNPRNFETVEQLAEMLEDYGDKPGALKLYRQAQSLDPQFEGLQRHIDALSRDVEGQGI
jgi:tetratricopeptide (TPR) repeat protein